LGKRVNGISKQNNAAELINKSTPKKKLNWYTELFRNFAGNEITPVDYERLNITKIITPIEICINTYAS
jgi:hypothetical protein